MQWTGCNQKFPDWPLGARTANGTALWHYVQLYRYFVSQSSEFCHHNSLCCFSTSVYCYYLFCYRVSPETFRYTLLVTIFLTNVTTAVVCPLKSSSSEGCSEETKHKWTNDIRSAVHSATLKFPYLRNDWLSVIFLSDPFNLNWAQKTRPLAMTILCILC
jgi:hypothetical protein